jgi:hypothetical protein
MLLAPISCRSLVLHETVPDDMIVQTVDPVLVDAVAAKAKKTAA